MKYYYIYDRVYTCHRGFRCNPIYFIADVNVKLEFDDLLIVEKIIMKEFRKKFKNRFKNSDFHFDSIITEKPKSNPPYYYGLKVIIKKQPKYRNKMIGGEKIKIISGYEFECVDVLPESVKYMYDIDKQMRDDTKLGPDS